MIEQLVIEAEEEKIEHLKRRRKLKNANETPKRTIKNDFR